MKKYLIKALIATSLISITFGQVAFASTDSIIPHSTTPISDNHIGTTTTIVKDPHGQGSVITTVYQKQITNYTSTATTSKDGITSTIDATFIDDKNSSEMTTVLNLKGFVPSGLKYNLLDIDSPNLGTLLWPYEYRVQASTSTPNVRIAECFPKNTIDGSEISNSISYSVGGGLEVSKQGSKATVNGSVAYSQSISYYQPEYKTVQSTSSNNHIKWNIFFNKTKDGYTINDSHFLYGNQMFMVSRQNSSTATNNITPKSQLSPLMSGGFSPNMGLILTSPNGTKKSTIKVSLARLSKVYYVQWNEYLFWSGRNVDLNIFDQNKEFVFEIDWENHSIRAKNN